ncbi:MAG TPA: alanine--glyoxylate aminotransferase family protein [Acidobacteriota bacterium]|nr:alanine--glyoxylate aminotransferase family protein [Acidobacteriota bacterium]
MIDDELTMIPGPSPVHRRILAALAQPTVSHQAPGFLQAFRECLEDLREVAGSASAQPFVFAGGGTLSMEVALVNVVRPGETILVISQGHFGDRYAELASAFGIDCDVLQCEWGQVAPPEELERLLKDNSYAAVTITHVDTSTGACTPAADYCSLLRGREEMVILDGVCATGGVPEPFEEWGIDVLLTAPQKALGVPPGLAITIFSERALAKRKSLEAVPAFYADIHRWLPVMENPGRYFSTPCVNQILALGEGLKIILAEGLEARFGRHRRLARAVRAGLAAMGLRHLTADDCLADTLSVVLYPEGVDDAAFRSNMLQGGVMVAGGIGPVAGKVFRLGHMGNIDVQEIAVALATIENSLISLGVAIDPGTALAAASSFFKE